MKSIVCRRCDTTLVDAEGLLVAEACPCMRGGDGEPPHGSGRGGAPGLPADLTLAEQTAWMRAGGLL